MVLSSCQLEYFHVFVIFCDKYQLFVCGHIAFVIFIIFTIQLIPNINQCHALSIALVCTQMGALYKNLYQKFTEQVKMQYRKQ